MAIRRTKHPNLRYGAIMIALSFVATVASVISLSACNSGAGTTRSVRVGPELDQVEAMARKADSTVEDAWFGERSPRSLKSGYARVSPAMKAKFAMDYESMLKKRGQNLAADLKS